MAQRGDSGFRCRAGKYRDAAVTLALGAVVVAVVTLRPVDGVCDLVCLGSTPLRFRDTMRTDLPLGLARLQAPIVSQLFKSLVVAAARRQTYVILWTFRALCTESDSVFSTDSGQLP